MEKTEENLRQKIKVTFFLNDFSEMLPPISYISSIKCISFNGYSEFKVVQPSIWSNFRTLSSSHKKPFVCICSNSSYTAQAPGSLQTAFPFCRFAHYNILYKFNHTIWKFLHLASFTQYHALRFIHAVFLYMNTVPVEFSQFGTVMSNAVSNTNKQIFLRAHVFIFHG